MLWEASTDKPIKLKALLEILLQNLDSARLVVTQQGITVADCQNSMTVTATIAASAFCSWAYNSDRPVIYAGVPHAALQDLKTFKSKSKVTLCLMGDPDCSILTMKIVVVNGDMSTSINMVVNHCQQEAAVDHPTPLSSFSLKQTEFTILCKTFKQGPVTLGSFGGRLVASGGIDGIKVKEVAFGAPDNSVPTVKVLLQAEKLTRLSKMGQFSDGLLIVHVSEGSVTVRASGMLGVMTMSILS
ncbi:putative proliferating cell nuclear antigen [Largemouth bass virus]|uniref:Proliferating cell nuclear antigen n=1 Tax=Largemouth bass virus TaxID=176656 RepID=A0A9X7Y3K4_9VIRU|nr:hypothetical protein OA88_23145 [Flavobacterium sp. JRM]QJE49144.1 hypothetical protein LMBV_081 [Largemouth bass virus]QJE49231.1 putative proliferating cell nuclear antigen [Largemouth bass virus]